SSSGKSSIAEALRARWDGPLQVSGIDTFLGLQSRAFFATAPDSADGFTWRPVVVDGIAAVEIVAGPLGDAVIRAAPRYWRACADAGIDQVCDDVWLSQRQHDHLAAALSGVDVLWIGARCPVDVLERRERERGDRTVGQARAQATVVHTRRTYDVEVDTSRLA